MSIASRPTDTPRRELNGNAKELISLISVAVTEQVKPRPRIAL
jgi:hypothetical protein